PHGSTFTPILERQMQTTDLTPESAAVYDLCYKCHSRDSILADQSFQASNSLGQDRGHRYHILDAKAACTAGHHSHGAANGSVINASRLINFNNLYVTNSSSVMTNSSSVLTHSLSGLVKYVSTGTRSRACTLSCHGKDHNNVSYPAPPLTPIFKL